MHEGSPTRFGVTGLAVVAGVSGLFLLAFALAGCDRPLTARLDSMSIQRLTTKSTDYVATCMIDNPNDHALQIEEVRWTLLHGQKEITHSTSTKNYELPGGKVTPLKIYLHVPAQSLSDAGLASQACFDYRFVGQVRMTGPAAPVILPFASDGRMPVVHPLEFELKSIEHVGVTETKVGLALRLLVTNPNELALVPCLLTGTLLLNERPYITLNCPVTGAPAIPPHQSALIRIPIWVNSPELGIRTLANLLNSAGTRNLVGDMTFCLPGTGDITDMLSDSATIHPASQPASQPDSRPDTRPD